MPLRPDAERLLQAEARGEVTITPDGDVLPGGLTSAGDVMLAEIARRYTALGMSSEEAARKVMGAMHALNDPVAYVPDPTGLDED